MALPERDPNRYAGAMEAAGVRARLAAQADELLVLRENHQQARRATADAEARLCEKILEEINLLRHIRDDAASLEADLQRRLDVLTEEIVINCGLLHPVRKMPLELLGEIFEYCLVDICDEGWDDEHLLYENDIYPRQVQPFRLAAVCRRWRMASFAAPRVWSHVALSFDSVTQRTVAMWMSFLGTVLQRSGAAPICIFVARAYASQSYHAAPAAILANAMSRCCFLRVAVKGFTHNDALLAVLGSRSPRLLHASLFARDINSDSPGMMELLPGAHNLRRLMSCNVFRKGPTVFPALTSLSLTIPHCLPERDDIAHVIETSPLLKYLVIELPIILQRVLPTEKAVAPSLTHMGVILFGTRPFQCLADFLEFPNLSTLFLKRDKDSDADLIEFVSKLATSSSRLSRLTFESSGEAEFLNFLPVLPLLGALVALNFDGAPIWTITKRDLHSFCTVLDHPRADGSWICCQLDSISFGGHCKFDADCDPEDIYRLIQKRLTACDEEREHTVASLSTFTVAGWPSETRAVVQHRINAMLECIADDYT